MEDLPEGDVSGSLVSSGESDGAGVGVGGFSSDLECDLEDDLERTAADEGEEVETAARLALALELIDELTAGQSPSLKRSPYVFETKLHNPTGP